MYHERETSVRRTSSAVLAVSPRSAGITPHSPRHDCTVTANHVEHWHGAMVPPKFEEPPSVVIVTDEQASLLLLKDKSRSMFEHAWSARRKVQRDLLLGSQLWSFGA